MSTNTTRRRRGVALLAAAAVTAVAVGAGTSALFTDSEVVADNTFTSGTLDLTAAPASHAFDVRDMAPGDRVAQAITLTNSGTVQLNWTPSVRTTAGELARVLQTQAFTVPDAASCTPGASAAGSVLNTAGWGDDLVRTFTGDVGGVLGAGGASVLCLTVEFDRTADTTYSGTDATLEWIFDAEQDDSVIAEPVATGVMALTYNLSAPSCTTQTVTLPAAGVRAGTVDWGDGATTPLTNNINHAYADKGTYTVTIDGAFDTYGSGEMIPNSSTCLISVDRWDDETGTTNLSGAFVNARNMTTVAEIPAGVTDLSYALSSASALTSDLSGWDTSEVTNMAGLFRFGTLNPVGIENWDVSKVTNMDGLFQANAGVNRDLSGWDVSSVTTHENFDVWTDYWDLPKPAFTA
ncbi:TasA family protein [Cellulosimicrobium sp. Marseille-Q4280]|uniref:TasA family protein n=1 Tax=Cellulosimicrobium sp. Marseille-Q4280 TaxID=2937992 RepID=UPI002040C673|nr:TasA family protein [Cellulosimicrobium sp. Marseille-Q4280]